MYSILLIGQSNAAGRGIMSEVEPLDLDRQFVQRCGKWRPMYTPINPDRINAGTCLAESFAYRFVHHYNTDVGIIPCAYGGSKIGEWMPGEPLYENAVFQAKLAQRDSEIVGVLWHQGESDSFPDRYESWSKKCIFVFESLRKELNLGTRMLLPENVLRSGEQVLLDDYTVQDLEKTLQVPIDIVKSSGYDFINVILNKSKE